MIKFTIGGRSVQPGNLKDAVMAAVLEALRERVTQKLGGIRDPHTGEFPTVVIHGSSIDSLSLRVEGSPKLVALVKERLDMNDEMKAPGAPVSHPKVFLSYAFENAGLAEKMAAALQEADIETWWDRWCIHAGDSLRRKVEEGIGECTHFLVLLTPQSIGKPWVNQEIDAGLVRKLSEQCKFVPVRHDLPVSQLSPLLSGLHSPEITSDADIKQLINDIYGLTRRPSRGAPPGAVQDAAKSKTGYSAAATAIARLFVERSKHGTFADPQFTTERLSEESGFSLEDTEDALHELSPFFKSSNYHFLVQGALFVEFDRHWMGWNPIDDALRLAADVVNDPTFPSNCQQIAERYGWEPRRLNPAIHYLLDRRLIRDYRAMGIQPWVIFRVQGTDDLRRFVKSRS